MVDAARFAKGMTFEWTAMLCERLRVGSLA